jgi:hypothetical protein
MEKKVMKKELRMCMDYSENDCEKCYDEKDDVATRIVKEIIKSNKEKAERDRQNDGEVENKK